MTGMIRYAVLVLAVSICAPVLAQQPGQGKKKQPSAVEILKKVQKLMREIEKDLAKAGVKPNERRMAKIRKEIEKLMRSDKDQKSVREKLEELMKQSGMSSSKAAKEIEKLMKARRDQKTADEAIKKLMEQARKATEASQRIEKLFKQSMSKQNKALKQMDQVIKQAKRQMQHQKQQQQQQEKDQHKKKTKKDKKPKDPHNSKKEPPKKDYDPKKKDPKHKKKNNEGKTDRWGSLQRKRFRAVGSGDKRKVPEKYRQLIEWYFRGITGEGKKR